MTDSNNSNDNFGHLVHVPGDISEKQNIINELLAISSRITELRLMKSKSSANPNLNQHYLLQSESRYGSIIFGALKSSEDSSFFCLDNDTWIWYESWFDQVRRVQRKQTVRYEIHPTAGVMRVREGADYAYIEGLELGNFLNAVRVYYKLVTENVYS